MTSMLSVVFLVYCVAASVEQRTTAFRRRFTLENREAEAFASIGRREINNGTNCHSDTRTG
jgi:hypothetical protein